MMKEIYHIYLKKYQIIHTKPDGNERKTRFVGLPWQHVCDVSGLNALRSFFFPDGLWRHPISKTALIHLFAQSFDEFPSHTCYLVLDKASIIIDTAKVLGNVVYPNCVRLDTDLAQNVKATDSELCLPGKPKDSRALRKETEELKITYCCDNVSLKCGLKSKDRRIRMRKDEKGRTWKRYRQYQHKRDSHGRKKLEPFDIDQLRKELIW